MSNQQPQPFVASAETENTSKPAKPIHTIVLDSSPLLLNTPPLSTLLANSSAVVTTPSVISEIRDPDARDRIQTLYLPFLTLRRPKSESITIIKQFAQKTGDAAVLSKVDIEVLALAYELECERNEGDWRLRRVPGQKRLNGSPPKKDVVNTPEEETSNLDSEINDNHTMDAMIGQLQDFNITGSKGNSFSIPLQDQKQDVVSNSSSQQQYLDPKPRSDELPPSVGEGQTQLGDNITLLSEELSSDSDSAEWITPSNIKRQQAKELAASSSTKSEIKTLQVATITGDFAMQNVLLQMNLNLLSPNTCKRITHIKQTILRCHGCFATTKDMTKQFCPRCGNPTLTRVSCTTNDRGEVKLHLKANMQWNNKGNVFSIPKPVSGSANQKWKGPRQGGGQSGWGNDLILAEDQKEYIRAMSNNRRSVKKDLMDEDYLPNILTGDRHRGGDRIRVGAGRGINSKKK